MEIRPHYFQIHVPTDIKPAKLTLRTTRDRYHNPEGEMTRFVQFVVRSLEYQPFPNPNLVNLMSDENADRFRGFVRRINGIPLFNNLSDSTYQQARDYIDLWGAEKHPAKPIMVGNLRTALQCAIPTEPTQCGILLVYATDTIITPEDWIVKGHLPPKGQTWKSLLAGVVQLNYD